MLSKKRKMNIRVMTRQKRVHLSGKRIARRSLGTLLSFCLLMTMLSPSVFAEETVNPEHQNHEGNWTAWSYDDSLPDSNGNYYLTENVNLSETWKAPENIVLCLNGYTIRGRGKDRVILSEDSSLTLTGCGDKNGVITGGNAGFGGGIYAKNCNLNLYNCTISGNNASLTGGGVCVSGGTFNMYDGTVITNNNAQYGGGVYIGVDFDNKSCFNLYSGTISDNVATQKGGGIADTQYSEIKLIGGSIIGNKTNGLGGGIYSGSKGYEFSGSTVIKDNVCGDSASNVYCNNEINLEGDGDIYKYRINIADGFGNYDKEPIGIDVRNVENPFTVNWSRAMGSNSAGYSEYFTSEREGYIVSMKDDGELYLVTSSGNGTNTGATTRSSGGTGSRATYKLTFVYNPTYSVTGSGKPDVVKTYSRGTKVDLTEVDGSVVWYTDAGLTTPVTEVVMNSDITVYTETTIEGSVGGEETAVPELFAGDDSSHDAYVIGYSDGTVRPAANITRAETAIIFFRLLNDNVRAGNLTQDNDFSDVYDNMASNTAISTLVKLGILKGRTETTFDPNAPVTRAEFAAICTRFDTDTEVNARSVFTDISGHWAEADIERAVALGWIQGYGDGTFGPDQYITRAQAITIINRILCRIPETEDDMLDDKVTWTDNPKDAWYYIAVEEATNSHTLHKDDGVHEKWDELKANPDWTSYQ
jgi:hypothetical protein